MEVDKLLRAQFIREVRYTTWLAKVVLVKKANDNWRMCIDYIDLNKVCPKDVYPLPNIDKLVDRASGHHILSFLGVYSGYNQIPMYPLDSSKYCYNVMPFGLKNTSSTYQQLMNTPFQDQIGKNVKVYIDDMVVKSDTIEHHMTNLIEVFGQLCKYQVKLNP